MITSPIQFTPWIPTFKQKPAKGVPPAYIQISQNNGHLPMKFRLTAHPPSDNCKHIGHNNCMFPYFTAT
jgi:hypothetical protein